MTQQDYQKKRDEILAKLINDITIAGYGKADQPNLLIKRRDKQPFAGYKYCQDKAAQAIDALVLEVIGQDEDRNHRYNKNWQTEVDAQNYLKIQQRLIVKGDE